MSSGVNQNKDGANLTKYFESNIGFFVMSSQEVSMIDGAKPEIEGVNHDMDGAKCHVLEYFAV